MYRFLFFLLLFFALEKKAHALPHMSFELNTGKILRHKDAFQPWYPASLTKLMTAYIVFRALDSGEIQSDTLIPISSYAASQKPYKMDCKPGHALTLDHALKMMLVRSTNDIAVAIAEGVAGSEKAFVRKMNAEAQRLKMHGTYYTNPSGLFSPKQVTTVRDQALLVMAIRHEFPHYAGYFAIEGVLDRGKNIDNSNLLVGRYPGTDGMKTGFICESGFNLIASATRENRTIVSIVFGEVSARNRAVAAMSLLEEAFLQEVSPSSVRVDELKFYKNKNSLVPVNRRQAVCTKQKKVEDQSLPSYGNVEKEEEFFLKSPPGGFNYFPVKLQKKDNFSLKLSHKRKVNSKARVPTPDPRPVLRSNF